MEPAKDMRDAWEGTPKGINRCMAYLASELPPAPKKRRLAQYEGPVEKLQAFTRWMTRPVCQAGVGLEKSTANKTRQ